MMLRLIFIVVLSVIPLNNAAGTDLWASEEKQPKRMKTYRLCRLS